MTDAEITRLIVEGLRQVAPESDPSTLGTRQSIRETLDIDSFDFLNFLIGLHKTLGVEIPEADYGKLTTMEEMIGYLRAKAEHRG
jgi:acyl carrier protein